MVVVCVCVCGWVGGGQRGHARHADAGCLLRQLPRWRLRRAAACRCCLTHQARASPSQPCHSPPPGLPGDPAPASTRPPVSHQPIARPPLPSLPPGSSRPQSTLLVMRFSAASTTPSLASTPMQDPALEMASIAYSTCRGGRLRRRSGSGGRGMYGERRPGAAGAAAAQASAAACSASQGTAPGIAAPPARRLWCGSHIDGPWPAETEGVPTISSRRQQGW